MKERIEVLLSAEQIDKRMAELADELYQEFGDEQVELVCALKGAVVTIVDLAKKMKMPVTMNFMSVSSYGNSTESSGNININFTPVSSFFTPDAHFGAVRLHMPAGPPHCRQGAKPLPQRRPDGFPPKLQYP